MQPIDEAELPHAFLNAPLHSHSSPQPGLVAAYGQISVQTSDSDRFQTSYMTDPPQITNVLVAHTNCGVLCSTPQLSIEGARELASHFCVLLLGTWRLGLGSSCGGDGLGARLEAGGRGWREV